MTDKAYPELPEPLEIRWPDLNAHALGCGVEDRGLRDRYECAEYGWQDGVDKAIECVPDQLFTADQMRAYVDADRASRTAAGSGISDAPQAPDMAPPATSRERWMYRQGWLAALDARSHAMAPATTQAQEAGSGQGGGDRHIIKDHLVAAMVNSLTKVAQTYGQTQQLREHISGIVHTALAAPASQAAVSQQAGEDAGLLADAERYRWLRGRPLDWSVEHYRNGWATNYSRNELDAAIDAARQSTPQGGK